MSDKKVDHTKIIKDSEQKRSKLKKSKRIEHGFIYKDVTGENDLPTNCISFCW